MSEDGSGSSYAAARGADMVVGPCLGTQPGDLVAVLRWRASSEAALLVEALGRLGASSRSIVLSEDGNAALLASELGRVDRSLLVAEDGLPPALSMEILDLTRRHALPHLHLTRCCLQLFSGSYRADPERIARINAGVVDVVRRARTLELSGAGGTSATVALSPDLPVLSADGRARPGEPDNLPSGFVYVHPKDVSGTFVADHMVIGSGRIDRRRLARSPATFEIADGTVRDVRCGDENIAAELRAYLEKHRHAGRVGLVSLPTNYVVRVAAQIDVQDALLPGASLGLGYSDAPRSGAPYQCPIQLRLFARRLTVRVHDGPLLVEAGRWCDEWVSGRDLFR